MVEYYLSQTNKTRYNVLQEFQQLNLLKLQPTKQGLCINYQKAHFRAPIGRIFNLHSLFVSNQTSPPEI
jgi:hypothetical protein